MRKISGYCEKSRSNSSLVRTIWNTYADQIKEFTENITPSQSEQNTKVRSHHENITAENCVIFQAYTINLQ